MTGVAGRGPTHGGFPENTYWKVWPVDLHGKPEHEGMTTYRVQLFWKVDRVVRRGPFWNRRNETVTYEIADEDYWSQFLAVNGAFHPPVHSQINTAIGYGNDRKKRREQRERWARGEDLPPSPTGVYR